MAMAAAAIITMTTKIQGTITMADPGLYRLLAWLSPSYPVGAFAYSHGLEWANEAGNIKDEGSLTHWIEDLVQHGGGWSDAVIFAEAYDIASDTCALAALNDFAVALAPSEERHLETTAQGTAFLKTTLDAWMWEGGEETRTALGPSIAYPVAVAAAAAGHGIDKADSLHAFLHGVVANLVSAGVRMIPLGQTAGQRCLVALESVVDQTHAAALASHIDDVGGIAMMSDIAAMRHETQYTRIFRS